MAAEIGLDAITLDYASIEDAKKMSGLRLVLGNYAIPGPWREACKGLFYVKGISYTPVVAAGLDGNDKELREWTAQSSAPVAIWDDEPPRSKWFEQLYLAERLGPNPSLIPDNIEDRMLMFGYCNEICGESGYAWSKRLLMIHSMLTNPDVDDATRAFWTGFGNKYGYSPEAAEAAPQHMAIVISALASRLEQQKSQGSKFFIGNQLSALDIYWATFVALIHPLPEEQCPMATAFRGFYANADPTIAAALSPALLEHRDFIYQEYLELPIVF
jgi:glutathione S-transferase